MYDRLFARLMSRQTVHYNKLLGRRKADAFEALPVRCALLFAACFHLLHTAVQDIQLAVSEVQAPQIVSRY